MVFLAYLMIFFWTMSASPPVLYTPYYIKSRGIFSNYMVIFRAINKHIISKNTARIFVFLGINIEGGEGLHPSPPYPPHPKLLMRGIFHMPSHVFSQAFSYLLMPTHVFSPPSTTTTTTTTTRIWLH